MYKEMVGGPTKIQIFNFYEFLFVLLFGTLDGANVFSVL